MSSKGLFAFNIKVFKMCANVHIGQKMGFLSTFIVAVSLILTITFEVCLVIDLFLNGLRDFQRLCEDIPMAMAFLMVSYEFYNIIVQKKNIEDLLDYITTTIDVHEPSFGKESYKKSFMGVIVEKLDKFGFMNVLFGLFCVILWIIRPFLSQPRKYPFGNPWFPLDINTYYFYLWSFQSYVAILGTINTINIHIFYGKIMAVICEQFNILRNALKCVDEKVGEFGRRDVEDVIYYRTKECIRYHQRILKTCEKLQTCISGVLVCQYCFGISLCFAALASFSMNAFSGAFINLLNHIFLELSELYIFCWFANKVTDYSELVTNGVFYGRWYMHAPKTQHLLRFVVMRCRKPVIIKAGNILPASIGSYIWILQQSYSYFMVLRQVRSK